MILIAQLQSYCADVVSRISGLNHSLVVADESHLIKELNQLDQSHYPLLVASYPMGQSMGKHVDAVIFRTAVLYWVLAKDDQRGRSFTEEHARYSALQALALKVASTLLDDAGSAAPGCTFARHLVPDSLVIEPENLLAGCEGWSLAVNYQGTALP